MVLSGLVWYHFARKLQGLEVKEVEINQLVVGSISSWRNLPGLFLGLILFI